jgi:hypothetical protein
VVPKDMSEDDRRQIAATAAKYPDTPRTGLLW